MPLFTYKKDTLPYPPMTLVRPKSAVASASMTNGLRHTHPFVAGDTFVFLGVVTQISAYGVFVRLEDGRVFAAYAIDAFEPVPQEQIGVR